MTSEKEIIEMLFSRNDKAINKLEQSFGRLLFKLSYNIVGNEESAKECVNDTYLGVWNAIPPSRPNNLMAYVCKIARNTSLKYYWKENADKRQGNLASQIEEIEECVADYRSVEGEIEEKELTCIIEDFLDSLSTENRVIFMRRYWFAESYEEISERTTLSKKNISVRLSRIRRELRLYLEKRGVIL